MKWNGTDQDEIKPVMNGQCISIKVCGLKHYLLLSDAACGEAREEGRWPVKHIMCCRAVVKDTL